MASQAVSKSVSYKWPSYIRGYHEYKSVWLPTVGETLRLTLDLTNLQDTMTMMKDGYDMEHIPRTVSQTVSFFLRKDKNVGLCEVTGMVILPRLWIWPRYTVRVPVLCKPELHREAQ